MAVETYHFEDDGGIPNSPWPVLVYHDVEDAHDAASCEAQRATQTVACFAARSASASRAALSSRRGRRQSGTSSTG